MAVFSRKRGNQLLLKPSMTSPLVGTAMSNGVVRVFISPTAADSLAKAATIFYKNQGSPG
jgi:hypothetical protein